MSVRKSLAASFNTSHLVVPDLRGYKYLNLFGVDDATAIRNLANPAAPSTVIGTPSHGSDYIQLNSAGASPPLSSIETAISSEPGEDLFMWVVATRETAAGYLTSIGTNADGQEVDEMGLFGASAGPIMRNSLTSAAGEAAGVWTSNTAHYYMIMGWGKDRGHGYVQTGAAGVLEPVYSGTRTVTTIPKRASGAVFKFNPDGEGNIQTRYHAAGISTRIPPEAERLALYNRLRARANARGFIIVQ